MACNCGSKNRIRAAVESKFRVQTGTTPATSDLISNIRQRHLEALAEKEARKKAARRRILTPDEVVRLSHGQSI